MDAQEIEVAQTVLRNLQSEKYKIKSYIFQKPINLSEVPDYLDHISKPLDIETVSANLDNGVYATAKDFWTDAKLIFENAILYHGAKETKWIAKYAKDLLKALKKEKEVAEGGSNPQKKKISLKIKLGKKTSAPDAVTSSVGPDTVPSAAAPASKPKLKLKLPTKQNADSRPPLKATAVKAKPTQPKLKLKLSLSKSSSTPGASVAAGPEAPASTPATVMEDSSSIPVATSSKANSTPKSPLKVVGIGRGKELPKAVQASQQAAATTKPKKTTKTKKASAIPSTANATTVKANTGGYAMSTKGSNAMTGTRQKQSFKVLAGLKRRQYKQVAWFLQPITDKTILQDYKAKIKHPMDISKMMSKLERNGYNFVADFVLDLRRIFANCLRYNTSLKDVLRPVAVEMLQTAENLLSVFLAQPEFDEHQSQPYPPLLFCWKLCVQVLDTLHNLVNPSDGQPTVLYFLYPVSHYCGGQFPSDYKDKVPKPMDYGTVTGNLLEGRYQSVDDFAADCRLVISNCATYYNGREDGRLYVEQANRLGECLSQQLDQLARYIKSSKGASDRLKAQATVSSLKLPTPPSPLLLSILQEIRSYKYTDKATKITEPAMGPFEKPVSLTVFPDYAQHVQEQMDLQQVERKTKADTYKTPEDFEYDINLIFRNCEAYNSKRNGHHLVSMAKYGARKFRQLFYNKMRAFEDPTSVPALSTERSPYAAVESELSNTFPDNSLSANPSAPKRIKLEVLGVDATPRGKAAPRISLTAAQVSSASSTVERTKSPKGAVGLSTSLDQRRNTSGLVKANQPVPLHIAIARVKEGFPLRRALKSLQLWEADCARYFKELLRHPWLSAARPKFIFHVPVPVLFPELSEAYSAKIRKPMDLTTVECQLLVGSRYAGPEDFVQDVALVFANAIRFNKDGRDIGDPLSCAYYDASVHLLRYSRWLSHELLSDHLEENLHIDEPTADGLPPFSWKLTSGNRKKAREEMDRLVLTEPIEKSIEGDRYTWQEAECEKLLKVLRHQSDLRYMGFFIQPNYPHDYAAFISNPMDWEKVNRTLKKRQYDKFGGVISDLRLIFSNALKYNSQLQGTDTVSGKAYAAAEYMSSKLEAGINKMMLSVSDRLERERIDHANAEREIEAQDRAEEAAIRAAWKKEPDAKEDSSAPAATRPDITQKIRSVRSATQRREVTDFEIPFFDDEDNGQHERSYFELVKFQKSLFEKQRKESSKLSQIATSCAAALYTRLLQRQFAEEWLEKERKESTGRSQENLDDVETSTEKKKEVDETLTKPSSVLNQLEQKGRPIIKMSLEKGHGRRKLTKRSPTIKFD